MVNAHAGGSVKNVGQAHLFEIVSMLLIVTSLSQLATLIGAVDMGVKIRGVVSQEDLAEDVLLLPPMQYVQLEPAEIILRKTGKQIDTIKGIPKCLRGKFRLIELKKVGVFR
jgi:hypothetical protein